MEDDIFSTTNVSLFEEVESPRQLATSPVPFTKKKRDSFENSNGSYKSDIIHSNNSSEQWNVVEAPPETVAKATNFSMPLKHQENTVDILKKENFDLRLKIYFLETRLHDLSPANLENALKENVNLKVTVQRLTKELKKYKKMILELNAAIEIVNKPCPKQHGMTQEEKDELKAAVSEAEKYHEENDKLSNMVADISAENVRLRAALRSAKSEHEETDVNRKYRQAQITIQEQQQQIQALQSKTAQSKPLKEDPYLLNRLKGLEEELKGQRLENDAMMSDLEQKKKRVKELQNELNQYSIQLFDAKQQLKSKVAECERLARKSNDHGESTDGTMQQLKEENQLLLTELQSREQDIAALEDEVIKLLSYCEGGDQNKPIENGESHEKLMSLESTIQEKENKISMLTDELKNINKLHDEDIEALEEHIAKIQNEMEEKKESNKSLMTELEESLEKLNDIQKEYEDKLEKQFNELAVAIRERDVRIATLEGEREAQEDTMQREKEFLQEEIEELDHKLNLALQELKEKERQTSELKEMMTEDNTDNSEMLHLKEQLQQLNQNDEKWKERIFTLEYKLKSQMNAFHTLKHKCDTTNESNKQLSKLLEQARKATEGTLESSKVEQTLQKLNRELRKELEDKNRDFEHFKSKLQELQGLYNEQVEMNSDLTRQLRRRENMLSHSLSTFDTLKEHKEFMENILYEQATGTHSFRERSEPSTMKH